MKSHITLLKDGKDFGDEDEINVIDEDSNSDSDDEVDSIYSITSDSDDESDDDSRSNNISSPKKVNSTSNEDNTNNAGTSGQNEPVASTSSARMEDEFYFEDETDEVVKTFLKCREIHRNHPPSISSKDILSDICFHPLKNIIALASVTGDVLIHEYKDEGTQLVKTLELHRTACRDIEFNSDGSVLYSTGKDCSVILSDIESGKFLKFYENAHEHPLYSLTVFDENTFVTGDEEGTVKFWDLRQEENTSLFSMKEMEGFVSAMVTNEEKKYLVCASGDGTLATLNLRARKLHVRTEDYPQELTCLGLFKHGRKILVGGNKGNLFLYNWGEFGLHSDEIPSLTKKSINCMVPITENIVVTGGEDKVLRATSIFPNRPLGVVGQHDLSVEYLDISHDGNIIASYSYDNTVKFWNISYFSTLDINKPVVGGGKHKTLRHNLPSSKTENASDFYADL